VSVRALTREQVLSAAERVVDERGWGALTIAAVAQAVGVKGPSLYTHVAGLDTIRAEVQARTMAAMSLILQDAAMGRSGADALRAMCDAYRAFAHQFPNRYTAMTLVPVDMGLFVTQTAGAERALRAAMRAFDLTDDRATTAVIALFAAAHGVVSLEIGGVFVSGLDRAETDALYRDAVERVIASLEATGRTT
jgi:AcrR family transcriptional regulator